MPELGNAAFTLEEWAKRLDPNGKIDKIVEILNQTNEVLDDMLFVEGNLATGHRTTMRTGLPSVTWRKINQGVQPSKSTTVQVDDACGMCEGYAEVDKALADLNGNTSSFRMSEDLSFIESFSQEMATKVFYGDHTLSAEEPLGLSPRYPFKDSPNVVDLKGSGSDLTSLWFVSWGASTVHGIFPKGSKAGLQHNDKGQVTLEDAMGGRYEGYRTHYKWDTGLSVRDWRFAVRVCNIESLGATNNIISSLSSLISAINLIPNLNLGRTVIYCNKTIKTQFDVAAYDKVTPAVYAEDAGGKFVTKFMQIPIRRCDALLDTEDELIATP